MKRYLMMKLLNVTIHNTKLRTIDEETADNELFVVYNGTEIGKANDVRTEALDWHFKDLVAEFTTKNNE